MKEKEKNNNRPARVLEPALLTVRDLEQLLQIDKRSVARLTKKVHVYRHLVIST